MRQKDYADLLDKIRFNFTICQNNLFKARSKKDKEYWLESLWEWKVLEDDLTRKAQQEGIYPI